jgi:hypothetical protein
MNGFKRRCHHDIPAEPVTEPTGLDGIGDDRALLRVRWRQGRMAVRAQESVVRRGLWGGVSRHRGVCLSLSFLGSLILAQALPACQVGHLGQPKKQIPYTWGMKVKYCKSCGNKFYLGNKSKAQYCSPYCRMHSRSTNPAKYYKSGIYLTKSGRREHFDSGMEQLWMKVADEKNLNWCRADHIKIPYFNPQLRRQAMYQPDFIVKSPEGYRLLELKPYSMVDLPVNQAKFSSARKWAREHGYFFEVVTSPYQQ